MWILVQVVLMFSASFLRGLERDFGVIVSVLAIAALLIVWFFGDMAGYRLLVPTVPRHQLVPTAIVGTVGRIGVGVWATLYMPATLSKQAEQYGPIGLTFALFTLMLVAVVVNLVAPVIVTVWDERRGDGWFRTVIAEGESALE